MYHRKGPILSKGFRGQTTQSLWRITCPPPEQTPRTCREDPLGQKKRNRKGPILSRFRERPLGQVGFGRGWKPSFIY